MEEDAATAAFSALSNPLRLRLLRHLVAAGPAGMTAGAAAQAIGASPSGASFHLAALSEAQLIAAERQSRQILYRARFDRLGALIGYLLHDCCGNDPAVRSCCGM